ncbi:hypothetical protein GCM10009839_44020 [Catenulispora yoronensis]|uniref:Uncharacterized protein n=1 Tax=Catenulispora yoronensis TaxID=450799 RepID=A0ABP5G255_9ACTN
MCFRRLLEELNLTDEEKEALEGGHEVITALLDRLADTPTPAGPTPCELGTTSMFIPLGALTGGLTKPSETLDDKEAF